MKEQEVVVDYEMLNLEYHQDYMLKVPKIKKIENRKFIHYNTGFVGK